MRMKAFVGGGSIAITLLISAHTSERWKVSHEILFSCEMKLVGQNWTRFVRHFEQRKNERKNWRVIDMERVDAATFQSESAENRHGRRRKITITCWKWVWISNASIYNIERRIQNCQVDTRDDRTNTKPATSLNITQTAVWLVMKWKSLSVTFAQHTRCKHLSSRAYASRKSHIDVGSRSAVNFTASRWNGENLA